VNQESGEELMNFGLRDQLEALRWIQERLGR
jgi:carboxylesterase type B